MNLQRGLERVSAVWWGLLALFCLVMGVSAVPNKLEVLLAALVGIAACYGAHKVTCWVVAGFFAPRS